MCFVAIPRALVTIRGRSRGNLRTFVRRTHRPLSTKTEGYLQLVVSPSTMTSESEGDKMSVGDLRRWLDEFGESNKRHFQQNQVIKHTQAYPIRRKISQLEQSFRLSSSSIAGSEASSPAAKACDPVCPSDARFVVTPPVKTPNGIGQPPSVPRIRKFSSHVQPGMENVDCEYDGFRVVSVEKLVGRPKPSWQSGIPSWGDADDNFVKSLWNTDIDSDHVAAFYHEKTSWSDGEWDRQSDDGNMALIELEKTSVSAGYLTSDCSLRQNRRQAAHMNKNGSKSSTEDTAKNRRERSALKWRRRLPMLLCKSQKHGIGIEPRPAPIHIDVSLAGQSSAGQSTEATTCETEPMSVISWSPKRNGSVGQLTTAGDQSKASALFEGDTELRPSPFQLDSHHRKQALTTHSHGADWQLDSIIPGALQGSLAEIFGQVNDKDILEAKSPSVVGRQLDKHALSGYEIQRSCSEVSEVSTSLSVSVVAEHFGGRSPSKSQSAVQRRKDQLEQQWAANRAPTHSKKIEWQACRRTGAYRKKVVLEYD